MAPQQAGNTGLPFGEDGEKPVLGTVDVTRSSGITLRRLQIFWAVARSSSMTRVAKQFGVAQPSLSQQISSLETSVGAVLFDRSSNRMELTEDGAALLRLAERVLVSMQELEEGVAEIGRADRRTLRIAGLNSVLRVLLPHAMKAFREKERGADFDLHDAAPAEMLELLYARRIAVGLIAANAISPASTGFTQVPIVEDPYALAVPQALRLEGISDPESDLAPADRDVLNNVIQFTFGTKHTDRDQAWYDEVLPRNRSFARVRSYETGLGMVQQGLGVCLIPSMSAATCGGILPGLRLYRVDHPPRRIVALLTSQNARMSVYVALLEALKAAGQAYRPPVMHDLPACLTSAHPDEGLA